MYSKTRSIIIWLFLMAIVGSITWFLVPAQARDERAPALTPSPPPDAPPGDGPWVVRAYYGDRRQVIDLAAWSEPWEVHELAETSSYRGYVVLDVDRAGYRRLLAAGFAVEIDRALTEALTRPQAPLRGQAGGIPGYPCYRTVEETFDAAQNIAAAYPNLATWIDIGDSWEKTEPGGAPGYDLMVLRLSNAAIGGPKPRLFIMASMHAREYTPAELSTRFAEYLVRRYGNDPDVTWLLDYTELHLLLQANPDGRKKAETGLLWRKNTDNDYCSDSSSRGVDLNRNFAFQWGCCNGSSGVECSSTYRGPTPSSEPETQAIQNYVRTHFADRRADALDAAAPITTTGIFLDLHSYSELVLWPWGFTSGAPPNGPALQTLGRKLAYFNGYRPQQSIALYPTDGTTDDFAYGELGLAAYTLELGTSFFQDCAAFEHTIWPANLDALLYAAKAARAPYLIPAGPDALNVTVTPVGVNAGANTQLLAEINDTRYNNMNGVEPTQRIVAAEYYVDAPPWITATAPLSHPMTAKDGAFDTSIEQVRATIDAGGLNAGRHLVFVRGRDAGGHWGAIGAAFLYILEPGVSPVIEGYVRLGHTSTPLSATISAQAFQAVADPATGYYSMTVVSGTYDLIAVADGYTPATVPGVDAAEHQTIRQNFALFPVGWRRKAFLPFIAKHW